MSRGLREAQTKSLYEWARLAAKRGKHLTLLLNREPTDDESRMGSVVVVKGILRKHRFADDRLIGRNWEEVKSELGLSDEDHFDVTVL